MVLVIHQCCEFCCFLIGLFKISLCFDFCCDVCYCKHSGFVFLVDPFLKSIFPFIKDEIDKRDKPVTTVAPPIERHLCTTSSVLLGN